MGLALIGLTALFTLSGLAMYLVDAVGWAQFLWVLASGSAGAGFAVLMEDRR